VVEGVGVGGVWALEPELEEGNGRGRAAQWPWELEEEDRESWRGRVWKQESAQAVGGELKHFGRKKVDIGVKIFILLIHIKNDSSWEPLLRIFLSAAVIN
jgi:hypothetical protein